jgi:transposase
MIKLIEKQKIIISHYREGKSQRQISKELGINRRTIRKYIKDYEIKKAKLSNSKSNCSNKEELIADLVEKVKLTDEIISRVKFYLRENEVKRAEGKVKQQKKKIDIYEALREEGFDIGYTTVCNTISNIKAEAKEAYIRQEYELGEVCEFDFRRGKTYYCRQK